MGLEIKFNPDALEAVLEQVGERAVKHMANAMRETTQRAVKLARDYAPVKTRLLEDSIDWETMRRAGVNGRTSFIIFINVDALRRDSGGNESQDGKTLADYVWLMEENLHPYGRGLIKGREYNLGKLSRIKRAAGKKVGGKFLSRALRDAGANASNLEKKCGVRVRKVLGERIVPMNGQRAQLDDEGED